MDLSIALEIHRGIALLEKEEKGATQNSPISFMDVCSALLTENYSYREGGGAT